MKSGILPRALLAAVLLFVPPLAVADVPVPPLKSRVTDLTATLSGDQVGALEQKLAALEARKGSQLAVLLVPTTQPETVEQFATRVFDQWKLGRKGVDDGVLLLIAKNDRKLRIEVGRGLEGAIPDAYAKRIIDDEIVPPFKQGNFAGGIDAGVARITKLIDGEPMPLPKQRAQPAKSVDYLELFFYGFIALMVFGGILRAVFGRFLGSGIVSAVAGVAAYFLIGALAAAIIAVVAFLVTLFGDSFGGQGNGWSSGGGGFSSGGSGSSGGGGFSGGGGDSGGGGASGSW